MVLKLDEDSVKDSTITWFGYSSLLLTLLSQKARKLTKPININY